MASLRALSVGLHSAQVRLKPYPTFDRSSQNVLDREVLHTLAKGLQKSERPADTRVGHLIHAVSARCS
jgi:hypothetical protein